MEGNVKNINLQIENYRSFLNTIWPNVEKVMGQLDWDSDSYWADDLMEYNWKLLVERVLLANCGSFQNYGFGKPILENNTHKLVCMYAQKRYLFRCLNTIENGAVALTPPFDQVYVWDVENKKGDNFPLQDLEFTIEAR